MLLAPRVGWPSEAVLSNHRLSEASMIGLGMFLGWARAQGSGDGGGGFDACGECWGALCRQLLDGYSC